LKKGAISLNVYLLSKASAKIPPVPPFEKGGRRGDLKRPLQKAKLIRSEGFRDERGNRPDF
jgi:hypothetical protein